MRSGAAESLLTTTCLYQRPWCPAGDDARTITLQPSRQPIDTEDPLE
jgi:hypothetical protein